jgi:hypothetical protein
MFTLFKKLHHGSQLGKSLEKLVSTKKYMKDVRKVRGLAAVRRCYAVMPPSAQQRRTSPSPRTFQKALVFPETSRNIQLN